MIEFKKPIKDLLSLSFEEKKTMLETVFKPSTDLFDTEETCDGFIKVLAIVKGQIN